MNYSHKLYYNKNVCKINLTLSVKTFDVGPMFNIVYLIWDKSTKDAAIVDPAWDLTDVLNFINQIISS